MRDLFLIYLFITFVEMKDTTNKRINHKKQINKVLDYITAHLGTPISVDELAEVAGLSPYHFHRVFHAESGETIAKYIIRRRMEKAGRELRRNTDTPISDIAYNVGYNSASVFCRNFKQHFGVTASEYRDTIEQQESKISQSTSINEENISAFTRYICNRKTIKIGDKIMNCTFEIKDLEPKQVVYYRMTGAYDGIGAAIGKLMQWAYPRGLVAEHPIVGTVYLDDPAITEKEKLQSDVFLVINRDIAVDGAIGKYTIDGGKYAVGRFEISITEYGDAWGSMCRLITEHGCQSTDGYHYEVYLNNPDEHPEKKHIIDICIPIKPL